MLNVVGDEGDADAIVSVLNCEGESRLGEGDEWENVLRLHVGFAVE